MGGQEKWAISDPLGPELGNVGGGMGNGTGVEGGTSSHGNQLPKDNGSFVLGDKDGRKRSRARERVGLGRDGGAAEGGG